MHQLNCNILRNTIPLIFNVRIMLFLFFFKYLIAPSLILCGRCFFPQFSAASVFLCLPRMLNTQDASELESFAKKLESAESMAVCLISALRLLSLFTRFLKEISCFYAVEGVIFYIRSICIRDCDRNRNMSGLRIQNSTALY